MFRGAITGYIDVAQLVLYAFWIFFAGLIFYLHREDKREGYPLVSDGKGRAIIEGFPPTPRPKIFHLPHGGMVTAPRPEAAQSVNATPLMPWEGTPYEPIGNPLLAGVGPGAYAERANTPELTFEGMPRVAPLRIATDFAVDPEDPDPRGMTVIGADGGRAGIVSDIWVDRTEPDIRYLEVEVTLGERGGSEAAGDQGTRRILLPITFASRISGGRIREVRVNAITAAQFAEVPALADPDRVTQREEDRIAAYFAAGTLFATPDRLGPLL
uniref:Photosynthetic reaction center subunit H n=1 Tax=Acidicaldus sp. TaxID=1872105 RepID=A0A8J4M5T9_9PROT